MSSRTDRYHPYGRRPPPKPVIHTNNTANTSRNGSSSYATTQSSSGNLQTLARQVPLHPLFSRIRIHVVPTKLEAQLPTLYAQIEALGGTISSVQDCSFAVTALKGRPRLEVILGRACVRSKHILDYRIVQDCYERAQAFPISTSTSTPLHRTGSTSIIPASTSVRGLPLTVPTLPPRSQYLIKGTGPALPPTEGQDRDRPEDEQEDDLRPFDLDVALETVPKRAIMRCSPLVCVNQDIIEAIKPIYELRVYDAPDQKNSNVLSYKRSMSVLKAIPRRIKSGAEAERLQDLGPKVAERIDEFLKTGRIQESNDILASPRFQTLNLFASIFTIGTATAVELYDNYGCRTMEDIAEHYSRKEDAEWDSGVAGEGIPVGKLFKGKRTGGRAKRRSRDDGRREREGRMSTAEIVRKWMELKDQIDQKIPRAEVEEIGQVVKLHLDALLPGCRYTLTGGYRRGKIESNDVDVVFCPPEEGQDEGLLKDLYLRLGAYGIVTHVLQLTASSHQVQSHNNFDGLDKAFVLFRLPPKVLPSGHSGPSRTTRRVDLISAPKRKYATAVLGWSGSEMFERDLRRVFALVGDRHVRHVSSLGAHPAVYRATPFITRRHAENEHGLKFDSGGLRYVNGGAEILCESERAIFARLGLKWVHPRWRNANG